MKKQMSREEWNAFVEKTRDELQKIYNLGLAEAKQKQIEREKEKPL